MRSVRHFSQSIRSFFISLAFPVWITCIVNGAVLVVEPDGTLSYPKDNEGNRVPDYSYAGYRGGGVALPAHSSNVKTVSNVSGNDTAAIQAVIDDVSNDPLVNGHRGVVYLPDGTWTVNGRLNVAASGVVIRGESMAGTIINTTDKDGITFNYGNDSRFYQGVGSSQNVVGDVALMDLKVTVTNGSAFKVGQSVVVRQATTQAWINAKEGGGVINDTPWQVAYGDGATNIQPLDRVYFRKVASKNGNEITLDAPIYDHLLQSLGQVTIFPHDDSGFTTENGVENLTINQNSAASKTYGIRLFECVDFWVKNLTVNNYWGSHTQLKTSRRGTLFNVHGFTLKPPDSGKDYTFEAHCAQDILVDTWSATGICRHAIITNGGAGDVNIVAVRGTVVNNTSSLEVHQRWGQALLLDNISFSSLGFQRIVILGNRADFGESHGWSAVHSTAYRITSETYNGKAAHVTLHKPPRAENYLIAANGVEASLQSGATSDESFGAIQADSTSLPVSLYDRQLELRLNKSSPVHNIILDSPTLDFGCQLAGTSADLAFEVTNTSNSTVSGFASVDAPFTIVSGSPYTISPGASATVVVRYSPVSDGLHTSSVAFAGGGNAIASVTGIGVALQTSLSFNATAGTILAPMANHGVFVAQSDHTPDPADGGLVVYAVNIPATGTYKVQTLVNAPSTANDSFFVSFDDEPESAHDTWDILPLTSGFEVRVISQRGSGTFDAPQYAPATWTLSEGVHFLKIRGRERDVQLQSISVVPAGEEIATTIPTPPTELDVGIQ